MPGDNLYFFMKTVVGSDTKVLAYMHSKVLSLNLL